MVVHTEETKRPPDKDSTIVYSALSLVAKPIRPLIRHLLPFIACLLCIPILLTMSGAAGWLVWKGIPTGWSADVYLQYGDLVNPYADVELPSILYDQPYDVSLHLVLPATESNYALGNFMASLRLSNSYNRTLAIVRRPAVLVPNHQSFLRQLLTSAPSIVKTEVPLLSGWIAGTTDVIAYVELGRNDVWRRLGNGQARELSVLRATLTGTVRPTGIRSILSKYPRLSTFISSFIFFFLSIIIVTVIIFSALGRSSSKDEAEAQDSFSDSDLQGEADDDFNSIDENSGDIKSKAPGSKDGIHKSNDRLESTGIRRRISNLLPSNESLVDHSKPVAHVKIEEDVKPHHASSAVYPKSPYPGPDVKEDVFVPPANLHI